MAKATTYHNFLDSAHSCQPSFGNVAKNPARWAGFFNILRQRGFNQSAMIARHVSNQLNIPCCNDYLVRHKFAAPQIELTARQRRNSVNNAFIVNHHRRYDHIALVDDVVTTTHTVNQAARALKIGGTQYVSVWSLARNT